jgi:hypothetical protein
MAGRRIEAEVAEAFGREFVKGNVPEVNEVRCTGRSHCAVLCGKPGPDAPGIRNRIGDGARDGLPDGGDLHREPSDGRETAGALT